MDIYGGIFCYLAMSKLFFKHVTYLVNIRQVEKSRVINLGILKINIYICKYSVSMIVALYALTIN